MVLAGEQGPSIGAVGEDRRESGSRVSVLTLARRHPVPRQHYAKYAFRDEIGRGHVSSDANSADGSLKTSRPRRGRFDLHFQRLDLIFGAIEPKLAHL